MCRILIRLWSNIEVWEYNPEWPISPTFLHGFFIHSMLLQYHNNKCIFTVLPYFVHYWMIYILRKIFPIGIEFHLDIHWKACKRSCIWNRRIHMYVIGLPYLKWILKTPYIYRSSIFRWCLLVLVVYWFFLSLLLPITWLAFKPVCARNLAPWLSLTTGTIIFPQITLASRHQFAIKICT